MSEAFTDPHALLAFLGLTAADVALSAGAGFPFRVPRGFAARMRRGDPADPLLRQVLPLAAEEEPPPSGYGTDPVGDLAAVRTPGLLHKYHGRVLLTVTGACAVNCRYCFRRHFPYAAANPLKRHWDAALAYIAAEPGIDEVILSGGDPLMLSDERLSAMARDLTAGGRLRRLRLHTRLPVVLPERIDAQLTAWLAAVPAAVIVVIHANHPNEIDTDVRAALAALRAAGVTLLNQAVLLRGINDDVATQGELGRVLVDAGVLPYYLHMLDRTAGTAHFEVADAAARALMTALQVSLPGYLVPRLVREDAGAAAKTPLFPV